MPNQGTRRGGRRAPDQAAPANTTAVAVFDPVAAGKALAAAVESRKPQLAALLGVEAETERGKAMLDRFVTVALHAATSRPDLLRATKESLVESIRDAAMLGLEPVGATGDGSIVVYDEKVKEVRAGANGGTYEVEVRVPTAHFQPMYRGLLKLARRSKELLHVDAYVVYQGDEIEIDLGTTPSVRHFPVLDGSKRGNPIGAYAVAETRDGRRYVDYMTYAEIEVTRKQSRAKDAMAWTSFWSEMARKTVLRRLMKRLPLETLAEYALRIESEAEDRAAAPVAAVAETDTRRRLRDRFAPAGDHANGAGEEGSAGGAPDGASDPTIEAGTTDPAVSVDPRGAEPPDDVVEGETRPDPGVCGSESDPKLGPVAACVLPAGHANADETPSAHEGPDGSKWPNRKEATR